MGVRSDVGFAIKTQAYEKLCNSEYKEAVQKVIEGVSETLENDEGFLFVFRYTKWYIDDYVELKEFYRALGNVLDYEDYRIVAACFDYPESDDADRGKWYDNPWNLHRNVTVELGIEQ